MYSLAYRYFSNQKLIFFILHSKSVVILSDNITNTVAILLYYCDCADIYGSLLIFLYNIILLDVVDSVSKSV